MLTLVLVVIFAALVFEFINGFHDTANSIATVVATKVLTPGQAVILAAVMNLIGALTGTAVAMTIASGLVDMDVVEVTSQVILCALGGGIIWNLITWWKGLPSSSSHALIGGLIGAALAATSNNWDSIIWSEPAEPVYRSAGVLWKVIVPMVSSPVLGFAAGFLMMGVLFFIISMMARSGGVLAWLARPRWVNGFFGKAQIVSAAGMGFAHGMNDAQKTMGIIAALFVAAGYVDVPQGSDALPVPWWVAIAAYAAIALGTVWGGWRIIRTMGLRLTSLNARTGVAANIGATTAIFGATALGVPISTTHAAASSVVGAGTAGRRGTNWRCVGEMAIAWVVTIPATCTVGFVLYHLSQLGPILTWLTLGPLLVGLSAAILWAITHAVGAQEIEAAHRDGRKTRAGVLGLTTVGALAGTGVLGAMASPFAAVLLFLVPVVWILLYVMKVGPAEWHVPSARAVDKQRIRELRTAEKLRAAELRLSEQDRLAEPCSVGSRRDGQRSCVRR